MKYYLLFAFLIVFIIMIRAESRIGKTLEENNLHIFYPFRVLRMIQSNKPELIKTAYYYLKSLIASLLLIGLGVFLLILF